MQIERGKRKLPSFLYHGFFQPFSAAETEQIQNCPDAPIRQHADIDTHETQRGEQRLEQIAQGHPQGKHGANRQDHRVADIAGSPERAVGNEGEGESGEYGTQSTEADILGGGFPGFRTEAEQPYDLIPQQEYGGEHDDRAADCRTPEVRTRDWRTSYGCPAQS